MSKWIRFVECEPKVKTKVWGVTTLCGDVVLGRVEWWGPWRKYTFKPEPCTVFEQDCLRDIALFCEMQTTAHRAKPSASSAKSAVENPGGFDGCV